MGNVKKFCAVLVLSLCASAALAQDQMPPTLKITPELDTPKAQELLENFQTLCLEKYPDEQAIAAAMEKIGATPEPPASVHGILGGPGRGWKFTGKTGAFMVTLKDAPDRHCAIRAADSKPFAPISWRTLLQQAVAARKLSLSGNVDYDQPHADGSVAHAFVNLVVSSSMENYTMIVEEWPAQRHVETRLLRRIMTMPPKSP